MEFKLVNGLLIVLIAALSMLFTATANRNMPMQTSALGANRTIDVRCFCGLKKFPLQKNAVYKSWYKKYTGVSKKIVVGGSANWKFGVNYTEWALKTGPFYLNDTLVFKYDPPVDNTSHPHSVYLLPDYWSFIRCDLSRARRVANWTQGTGHGFEFRLRTWRPHFFACGEANGIHCDKGLMKFFIRPIFHPWHY